MRLFSALHYYLASAVTLMRQVSDPLQVAHRYLPGHSARPGEVRLKATGWRFQVRSAMDIWIVKETCLDRDYLWGEALQPDWSVVDIGAGLGDFSVLAGKECPRGIVHAYEPFAGSFTLLEANLALNGLENVRTFPEAVAAGAGQLAISSHNAPPVATRFGVGPGPAAVAAVTLATVLDRLPDGRCDFMKIDCEGCEFDLLLKSSADVLARIGRLSLETHEGYTDYKTAQLATWLRQQGFAVRQRPNPVHRSLSLLFAERSVKYPAG